MTFSNAGAKSAYPSEVRCSTRHAPNYAPHAADVGPMEMDPWNLNISPVVWFLFRARIVLDDQQFSVRGISPWATVPSRADTVTTDKSVDRRWTSISTFQVDGLLDDRLDNYEYLGRTRTFGVEQAWPNGDLGEIPAITVSYSPCLGQEHGKCDFTD